jgi:acetyl esterase/lipase
MKYITLILLAANLLLQPSIVNGQILTSEDVDLHSDIVFTTVNGHELLLDIAVPKYLKTPAPAIVDIPGGAWRKVDKKAEDAVFYAKHGFIGISITHRTSDIAVFPAAVHDCKTAIRWVRANAGKYNIDPNKIGVTGVSSGAHLATLLGTSNGDKYLEGNGDYQQFSSEVQAVVDHFGPTDFLQGDRVEPINSPASLFIGGALSENREKVRLANPITYIDSHDPPIWIGHGELDGMVDISQSEILFEALKAAGVPSKFVRVKNADHMYFRYKWDMEVSPTVDELFQHTISWFTSYLGIPNIDTMAIPLPESRIEKELKPYSLFYKFTITLPENTEGSYCNGSFFIKCGSEILAKDLISMKDFSVGENRIFQKQVTFSSTDLTNKLLLWNFRGEVFDATMKEVFEPGQLQNEKFDQSIEGVGFDLIINSDKSIRVIKRVYRKE